MTVSGRLVSAKTWLSRLVKYGASVARSSSVNLLRRLRRRARVIVTRGRCWEAESDAILDHDSNFTHRLEVRFRDCDPMGHVNNAVYLTYLEQARFAHWRALWGFGEHRAPAGHDARRDPRARRDRLSDAGASTATIARDPHRARRNRAHQLHVRVRDRGCGAARIVAIARSRAGDVRLRGRASPVPVPDDIREQRRPGILHPGC